MPSVLVPVSRDPIHLAQNKTSCSHANTAAPKQACQSRPCKQFESRSCPLCLRRNLLLSTSIYVNSVPQKVMQHQTIQTPKANFNLGDLLFKNTSCLSPIPNPQEPRVTTAAQPNQTPHPCPAVLPDRMCAALPLPQSSSLP